MILELLPKDNYAYHDLHSDVMTILLELRYGVYYKIVPPYRIWPKLTVNSIEHKLKTLQRLFYPQIVGLIHKTFKIYSGIHPNTSMIDKICSHKKPNADPKRKLIFKKYVPLQTGPHYDSINTYFRCKICAVTESKKCLH